MLWPTGFMVTALKTCRPRNSGCSILDKTVLVTGIDGQCIREDCNKIAPSAFSKTRCRTERANSRGSDGSVKFGWEIATELVTGFMSARLVGPPPVQLR